LTPNSPYDLFQEWLTLAERSEPNDPNAMCLATSGKEDIPRPQNWKGFRIIPNKIEFWVDGEYRLHQRYVYTPDGNGGWTMGMLYP